MFEIQVKIHVSKNSMIKCFFTTMNHTPFKASENDKCECAIVGNKNATCYQGI